MASEEHPEDNNNVTESLFIKVTERRHFHSLLDDVKPTARYLK